MTALVAVVGSANLDIVVHAARRPAPGETVIGVRLDEVTGGKGANQAVATAKTAPCAFVGRIGGDAAGDQIVERLLSSGVDTEFLGRSNLPTGRALIVVTPDGENTIIVVPNASAELRAEEVGHALDRLTPGVVLTQLEVPVEATWEAARWCARHGARFVLNLSPIRDTPGEVLAIADPLVVNEVEAAALLGVSVQDVLLQDGVPAATALAGSCGSVVLTLGARGVVVGRGSEATVVPGLKVVPVDTTGAGDVFAGRLAADLAGGAGLVEAARAANVEAARVVSLPRDRR
jgi:ribokinase